MDRERAGQLVEAGMWLQLTGDLEGAMRLFEQALVLDPQNARARELVGAYRASTSRPPQGQAPRPEPVAAGYAPSPPPTPPPQAPPGHGGAFRPTPPGVTPSPKTPPMGQVLPRSPQPPPQHAPPAPPPKPVPLAEADWAGAADSFDVTVEEPVSTPPAAPPRAAPPVQRAPSPPAQAAPPRPAPFPFAPPAPPSRLPANAKSAWDSSSEPGVHVSQVSPGLGDAMDLVGSDRTPPRGASLPGDAGARSEVQALLRGARDLLELDDHSGAMELILKAQALAPNDPAVQTLRERSEGVLLAMYESRIGPMSACPRVVLKDDEIIWLNFDHRAGFVLAQIDGTVRFEDLFEVCGMSRIDTARILAQLLDEGVIAAG